MLRQLAVFAGGWTLAGAVRTRGVADEYDMLDLLTRLVDKSLSGRSRADGSRATAMLETVVSTRKSS